MTTAVVGAISYATGNESLAGTLFQVSQYAGYASAALCAATLVNAAIAASRSTQLAAVDLDRIVVTRAEAEAYRNAAAAAEAAGYAEGSILAGIAGAASAVGSSLAIDVTAATYIVNNIPAVKLESFLIDKAINGFSLCPRYGYYGGLDWSGAKQIRTGMIGPDIPPMDQMDGTYKEHDFSSYNALKVSMPAGRRSFRVNADKTLYKQLRSLPEDPSRWSPPAPDPDKARVYRKMAEWWFGDILGYKNN